MKIIAFMNYKLLPINGLAAFHLGVMLEEPGKEKRLTQE